MGLQVIQVVFLFILWLLFAFVDGRRDAYYYHLLMTYNNKPLNDLHPLFTFQRSIFATVLCICFFLFTDHYILGWHLLKVVFFGISLILSFSLLHNGSYYMKRNDLNTNVYRMRFTDSSTTSTSEIELGYKERRNLFLIGIVFLLASILM